MSDAVREHRIRDRHGNEVVLRTAPPAGFKIVGNLAENIARMLRYETGLGNVWTLANAEGVILDRYDELPHTGEWELVEVGGDV